ncbi:hypothetical protein RI367_005188 [Sorochytrium milnesiophthora]
MTKYPNGGGSIDVSLGRLQDILLTPVMAVGPAGRKNSTQDVLTQTLWKDQPVLMVLIRRPGCLFCRNEAVELRKRKKLIEDQYGVRMVAVVNEKLGAQDFASNFWRGETYFDHSLGLFKAFGNGQVRKVKLWHLLTLSFWKRYFRVRKAGFNMTAEGKGMVLGGLLVLGIGESGVQYAYAEKTAGQIAPIDDVLAACLAVRVGATIPSAS